MKRRQFVKKYGINTCQREWKNEKKCTYNYTAATTHDILRRRLISNTTAAARCVVAVVAAV